MLCERRRKKIWGIPWGLTMFRVLCAASTLAFGFLLSPALAETLPTGAKPLAQADVTALFAGKTYSFKETHDDGKSFTAVSWFLGADGSMLGYAQIGPSFATGTWTASDGKLCVSNTWAGSWGQAQSSDCQLWAADEKSPKKLYRAEISKGGDYAAFKPVLANGDAIAGKIDALKKKLGK